MCKALVFNI